jgi:ParB family chromosome partitioning protein
VAVSNRVEELAIDCLTIHKSQVRTRGVRRDLDELVNNLRIHGQLEPIVVSPTKEPGRYEIIAGQRRWLAAKELGWTSIRAVVFDEEIGEPTARAISISENLVRHAVEQNDMIDACTELYRRYGSIRAVVEEVGLPYYKVRAYVKFDRLRPYLKECVVNGEIDVRTALRIEDHAGESCLDDDRVTEMVRAVKGMTNAQKKHYFQSAPVSSQGRDAAGTSGSGDAASGEPGGVHQMLVTLLREDYGLLRAWAGEKRLTQDRAAARIISGYLRKWKQVGASPAERTPATSTALPQPRNSSE